MSKKIYCKRSISTKAFKTQISTFTTEMPRLSPLSGESVVMTVLGRLSKVLLLSIVIDVVVAVVVVTVAMVTVRSTLTGH